jgi:hypothetical protein
VKQLLLVPPYFKLFLARFEEFAGEANSKIHSKNYEFLDSMREKEISEIQRVLKKTKNKERRDELQQELFV